ncbi:hypothetical protein [Ramlibacter rhizophilus]|uniref:Uncharacterized protein n=1 Tax=Ramlibacter rhizophilus TaxID=1781167 RepID=A0A4Z0C3U8_9BURK|nr:hypothetical protein [Ramlibacter rhizophilus]TFZ04885.1 hypothetical protein EZ242_03825 [Ramlibacter rhizophilus]
MERIPPNKKRAREGDDIALPPTHRPTPPLGSHPAAGSARVRPTPLPQDDGKALRLRDVQTGAGPQSDPLRARHAPRRSPPEGRPGAARADAAALSVLATDPPLVEVRVGAQLRYARARLANMDKGLVIARRSERLDGLYSMGFASCRAVILESSCAVGLSHTALTGDDFVNHVRACVRAFRMRCGAEAPRLTIGHAPDLYADALAAEWHAHGPESFLRSEQLCFGPAHAEEIEVQREEQPDADAEELCRNDVAVAMRARVAALRRQAGQCGAHGQLMTLPRGALLVPLHGPIDLLDPLSRTPRPVSSQAAPAAHGRSDGAGRADRKADPAAPAPRATGGMPATNASGGDDLPHGALVSISVDGAVRYPRARLVADDSTLVVRPARDPSCGLFARDLHEHLLLVLQPPPEPALAPGGGPLPRATALVRIEACDPRYVLDAAEAVQAFGTHVGFPVHVRVAFAPEDFESTVVSSLDQFSAKELLRIHRIDAEPPPGASDEERAERLVALLCAHHRQRAETLAQRLKTQAPIALPNASVLLTPSGELDGFGAEAFPQVVLAHLGGASRGAAGAGPALPAAEADIPHGATVRVSDGPDRVYPRAHLVANEAELTVRTSQEASSGLFTQEIYEHLVLALVGPRRAAPDGRADGLPSATALVRLDTTEDNYLAQADEAVRAFESQAGRPVRVRVVAASEVLEARIEAETLDAETLLRRYRIPSHPPQDLSGDALHGWVVERIIDEHNARADRLAARHEGSTAIAVPNNAILLAPDGELVTFEDEPAVELALPTSSGREADAAPPARRGDGKGARPAQAGGPRHVPGPEAPPRAPGGHRVDPGFQQGPPVSGPSGLPMKPPH